MKKFFLVLLLLFLSCNHPMGIEKSGTCDEQRFVTQSFITSINHIKDKEELTIDDAKELIRPLSSNFRVDTSQCTGYTNKVTQAAKNVLSQRSDNISDYLLDLCSQPIPATHDLELIGAITEQKQVAKAALEYINKPTELCE